YNYFKYIIILFRLINALVIFQNYIYIIFYRFLNNFYIIYLDNIFIFLLDRKSYIKYIY
ncbi:uncharacterized protein BO80DRAFT_343766, partial [Aspergillus ibericus CBS 121593]